MALRNILRDSDPALRKTSRVVDNFDKRLHILLDDLRETLEDANGAGLAAPQAGVLRRVCVVDVGDDDGVVELVNPRIIAAEGEQTGQEGCLSIPGMAGIVTRPMTVTVQAQDRYGKVFEITGTEIKARAFCHEIDHLDGTLYTDIMERFLTEEEMEDTE